MSLKEHLYSVLIVSATESFTSTFSDLFSRPKYSSVDTVTSISLAKRALEKRSFDLIIVNAPLPDDAGTRFAIDTCINNQAAVLLLVKNDVLSLIHDRVVEYGVFTLPKPISKATMACSLNWLESMRERLRQFEKKSISIEDKMVEIRLVNKAKWLLISELHMNEPDAHRYIEKQAMDRCVAKRCVAEEIIKTYS